MTTAMNITRSVPLWPLAVWGLASAEPTPTVRYLMKEPMSLWDKGMIQLRDHLKNDPSSRLLYVTVEYDWDANRIRIGAVELGQEALSATEAKPWCKRTLESLRAALWVHWYPDPTTGEPVVTGSMIPKFFWHEGYTTKPRPPDNLADELHSITELSAVYTGILPDNQGTKIFTCRSPLLSDKVLFEE